MIKYIYEYEITSNPKSIAYSNQMTVVYENKTYYYCKVNGTDYLRNILKTNVNTGDRYFTTKQANYDELIKQQEKYRLEKKAKFLQQVVQNYTKSKEQTLKKLSETQKALDTLSGHVRYDF